MAGLAGASTLCRVLMTLGRARASGCLQVEDGARRASLSLQDGCLSAVHLRGAESKCLGDLLDERGAWDAPRHAQALRQSELASPVGAWLVKHRVSSEEAVRAALRTQMLARVLLMCDWGSPELRFQEGALGDTVAPTFEPMPTQGLVLQLLRAWAPRIDLVLACARLTGRSFELSAAGRSLLELRDALREPEARLLALLGEGALVEDAVLRSGVGEWGFGFVRALELIAALEPRRSGAYPLLLQKHRQVRNAASPHALLDLPPGAGPQEARKALRRLVSDLHPDRLGDEAPEALQRVCGEVIRALVAADSRIAESG